MRATSGITIFSLFLSFFLTASALPIGPSDTPLPSHTAQDHVGLPWTPSYLSDPSVPLPGRTGLHFDPEKQIATMFYGDDSLPAHMGHLQRNQAQFPQNLDPMPLMRGNNRNRNHALKDVPSGLVHPVSGEPLFRDEKLLHIVDNPEHESTTTVEYVDMHESNREGGYTKAMHKLAEDHPNALFQLRPNPGWLDRDKEQRRGHEAPARLNNEMRLKGAKESNMPQWNYGEIPEKEIGPSIRIPLKDGSVLRVATKKHQRKSSSKRKADNGPPKNLREGDVSSPGHVWHPLKESESRSTHTGAPGYLDASKRQPHRPQNRKHHEESTQSNPAPKKAHTLDIPLGSVNRPIPHDAKTELKKLDELPERFKVKDGWKSPLESTSRTQGKKSNARIPHPHPSPSPHPHPSPSPHPHPSPSPHPHRKSQPLMSHVPPRVPARDRASPPTKHAHPRSHHSNHPKSSIAPTDRSRGRSRSQSSPVHTSKAKSRQSPKRHTQADRHWASSGRSRKDRTKWQSRPTSSSRSAIHSKGRQIGSVHLPTSNHGSQSSSKLRSKSSPHATSRLSAHTLQSQRSVSHVRHQPTKQPSPQTIHRPSSPSKPYPHPPTRMVRRPTSRTTLLAHKGIQHHTLTGAKVRTPPSHLMKPVAQHARTHIHAVHPVAHGKSHAVPTRSPVSAQHRVRPSGGKRK